MAIASAIVVSMLVAACPRAAAPPSPRAREDAAPIAAVAPTRFAAIALDGPHPSLAAFCEAARAKHAWRSERHCRLDDASFASVRAPSSTSALLGARTFRIDDDAAGNPIATCGLLLETSAGFFVRVDDDPIVRCEGRMGPQSVIETKVEELGWGTPPTGPFRLRVLEAYSQSAFYQPNGGGKLAESRSSDSTEYLVLCALGAANVPRCTPSIRIGCTEYRSDGGESKLRSLTWSLAGNRLHLRLDRSEAVTCSLGGDPLEVGDYDVDLAP